VVESDLNGQTVRLPALSESSRQALVGLLIHGPASRADLARRLRLSGTSLTRISRALEEENLTLDGTPNSEQRVGRPSQLVDVNVDRVHLIGVKLSSGSMNLARTDMRAKFLAERSVTLPSHDVQVVTDVLVREIQAEIAADDKVAAVGLSLAGPVSPRSEIIRLSPFLQWQQVPLVREMQQRTGLLAVVENDVRALTAAEHWFGAAAGSTDFALVTIGIGTGCGLVVDDQLVDGMGGGSGQIGHLPVTPNGPLCERGHRGCVRSYLSSTMMLRHAGDALARPDLTWDGLLELGRSGDPVVRRVLADAGTALGTVIGTVGALAAPSKVLISGESVDLVPLVRNEIQTAAEAIQHWTVPPVPIEVVPFTFTEWARGAAVIALQHLLRASVRKVD
jgi:predicted NBD/HSP70 family sugar kinase